MKNKIIGRVKEMNRLADVVSSNKAELVAIYGRRRVGKTFLVKEFFNNRFDFYATGIFEGKKSDQLLAFYDAMSHRAVRKADVPRTWMEAFMQLRNHLSGLKKDRLIVFLDELPWFDTRTSQFLKAFEWFWNSWGSTEPRLKLIVCGSATTWMTDKFISGKGGLYNRTTERIHLSPFSLHESSLLLKSNGLDWDASLVLEAYMVFGGVPLYLNMLKREMSLDANIDRLFFAKDAPLKDEYEFLFRSLFKESDYYKSLIDAISTRNQGVSRQEIARIAHVNENGTLTQALKNLVSCDFIRKYSGYGKQQRDCLYQLTDLSTLFHKRFIEHYTGMDEHRWSSLIDHPTRRAWTGIAFEQVCLLHVQQIKHALGVSGVQTDVCTWRYAGGEHTSGAQIDLLIVRRDKTINLCEMKYAALPFEITGKYSKELRERREIFRSVTGTSYALHLTMVSPHGVKRNANAYVADQVITIQDLFMD